MRFTAAMKKQIASATVAERLAAAGLDPTAQSLRIVFRIKERAPFLYPRKYDPAAIGVPLTQILPPGATIIDTAGTKATLARTMADSISFQIDGKTVMAVTDIGNLCDILSWAVVE